MPHKIGHTDPKITKERLSGLRIDAKRGYETFVKPVLPIAKKSLKYLGGPLAYGVVSLYDKYVKGKK